MDVDDDDDDNYRDMSIGYFQIQRRIAVLLSRQRSDEPVVPDDCRCKNMISGYVVEPHGLR
eukprot:6102593-Karenia_brevis.AAC.1